MRRYSARCRKRLFLSPAWFLARGFGPAQGNACKHVSDECFLPLSYVLNQLLVNQTAEPRRSRKELAADEGETELPEDHLETLGLKPERSHRDVVKNGAGDVRQRTSPGEGEETRGGGEVTTLSFINSYKSTRRTLWRCFSLSPLEIDPDACLRSFALKASEKGRWCTSAQWNLTLFNTSTWSRRERVPYAEGEK